MTVREAIDRRAAVARHAAAQRAPAASHVRTRAVALGLLSPARLARPEAILSASRLTDGEVGRRPCRGRLSFEARKRGANQRAVHRAFVVVGPLIIIRGVRWGRLRVGLRPGGSLERRGSLGEYGSVGGHVMFRLVQFRTGSRRRCRGAR